MVAPAPAHVLPVLVLAQLAGTSPWFAVNAVMPDLQAAYGWPASAAGTLTSAVQAGFIAGTLVFALLAVADRFSARRVFCACALAGALCSLGAVFAMPPLPSPGTLAALDASAPPGGPVPLPVALPGAETFWTLWAWRAAGGFFLAGIYPVGMKIAAQWFPQGLGAALGLLIGALLLGTASPHALRALGAAWDWSAVFHGVALASAVAGLMVLLALPEPPQRAPATAGGKRPGVHLRDLASLWTDRRVRASVLGYFGHMWELYSLLVLVPLLLAARLSGPALSWVAFAVIAAGALGCAGGGWAAQYWGSARVAAAQLAASGLCGLLAPWLLGAPDALFYAWLLVWGITVSGDSPQFSALTAGNAPRQSVGSVLTLTNCIGFAISIASIQLFSGWIQAAPAATVLPWLALGPALGLLAMSPLLRAQSKPRSGS